MWPGAFPKTPASQRLTPLGSLPRTLDQKKLISKVIPWGGPLSLSAWDCRISWDLRLSGLNLGKSQANLDKLVTLLPQYLGDEQSLGLSRTTNFFFFIFSYCLLGSATVQARSFFTCFVSFNPHRQMGSARWLVPFDR